MIAVGSRGLSPTVYQKKVQFIPSSQGDMSGGRYARGMLLGNVLFENCCLNNVLFEYNV